MLTQPNFLGEDILSPFSNCSLTDAGLKLRGFNKLFSNDLNYIEELVFDKFWIDTFYSLSTNVRVEGDTFTFKDLVHRLRIAWSSYKNNTNVKDVDYFIEKASSNVKLILQDFINEKILLIGYNLKCKQCSSKFWYSLDEIKHTHICKGCSNENFFDIEAPLSYKLNHLIKNNLAHTDEQGKVRPDGNFLIIKTIIDLYNGANNSFRFLPPLNIYKKVHPKIQYTDLDIICLVDGALIIGEAKNDSRWFQKDDSKCLNELLEIAEILRPDIILLSCTIDTKNRLQKACDFLTQKIESWPFKPEIRYYQALQPRYLFDVSHHYIG